MENCLFCKIVAGDIPSNKLYEDELVYAFADIHPQAPTHFLVIPKLHIQSIAQVDRSNSAVVARCIEVIALLAEREGLSGGFRVIANSGADAGQTVPHLHFHLLAGKPLGEKLL